MLAPENASTLHSSIMNCQRFKSVWGARFESEVSVKIIRSFRCAVLAIALFAIAMSPRSTSAQPGAPVTITTSEIGYVLDNGIIQALVSSKSGDLISMKYKGVEMLGTFMKEDGT